MSPLGLRRHSDAALVARLRAGDTGAFDALHRRYERTLRRFAEQIVRDAALAEEVVQDAFLRTHRLLLDPAAEIVVRPFLFRVVRNAALDALRADAARPVRASETLDTRPDDRADPAARVIAKEDLQAILRDIASLPERQREVLLRREVEGASQRDVAVELGISEFAVSGLSSRARENLVAGVAARDARCEDMRELLRRSHGLRRRATGDVHRHLRECAGCREYRDRLKRVRRAIHALAPGPMLGWAVAGGGSGVAVKSAATAAVAGVALTGGTLVFGVGEEQPFAVPAAKVLGAALEPGARVPAGAAVVRRVVHSSPDRIVRGDVPCPSGTRVAGAAPQPADRTSWGLDPETTVGFDRVAAVRVSRGPARRVTVVILCKRPDAHGSILAGATAVAAAKADIRKICVRRAYLFESPGVATIGSVYRGQPVRVRRFARKRRWASIRTDAGVVGWVRASALCKKR